MNIQLDWTLPTTRDSGKPLNVSDIAKVVIDVSADGGASFAPIGEFLPDTLSTVVTDLDFATWLFRGVVVDVKDRPSLPEFFTVVNEDTSPPSKLAMFKATVI